VYDSRERLTSYAHTREGNRYYLAKEKLALKDRFLSVAELNKIYNIYSANLRLRGGS